MTVVLNFSIQSFFSHIWSLLQTWAEVITFDVAIRTVKQQLNRQHLSQWATTMITSHNHLRAMKEVLIDVIMQDHLVTGSLEKLTGNRLTDLIATLFSFVFPMFSGDSNEIPMPACHMKIYSHEKLAENVKIGDPLKLMINIDKQESYGLHITDCLVRDGIGWGEQKLIDSHGCPLDQEILGPFSYDSDRTKATVAFPAHKFPYTTSVYYQCNVRLCSLEEENCHKVRKRTQKKSSARIFNLKLI